MNLILREMMLGTNVIVDGVPHCCLRRTWLLFSNDVAIAEIRDVGAFVTALVNGLGATLTIEALNG